MKIHIDSKSYGSKLRLKDVHLVFPKGKMTLIIGTSGAGKSTLIKCIIGTTHFNGEALGYSREDIGYIPQFPALNVMEKAEDAVFWPAVFSRNYGSRQDCWDAANEYLEMLGLASAKKQPICSLSGGQKQRVSIAKELVRKKDILVADEIDTGLDSGVSKIIIKKLREITYKEDKTTIIISHNLSNMELYDYVAVLAKDNQGIGQIAYFGKTENIKCFFGVREFADILVRINTRDEGGYGEANKFINDYKLLRQKGSVL